MASTFRLNYGYVLPLVASDVSGQTLDASPDPGGSQSYAASFGDGTGANKHNKAYRDHRTLTNAAFTYTLSSLPNGQVMTAVRGYVLEVLTPVGTLSVAGTLGPGATHGWTNGLGGNLPIGPGSILAAMDPDTAIAVAAGSNDTITVTVTGTMEYKLIILGVG